MFKSFSIKIDMGYFSSIRTRNSTMNAKMPRRSFARWKSQQIWNSNTKCKPASTSNKQSLTSKKSSSLSYDSVANHHVSLPNNQPEEIQPSTSQYFQCTYYETRISDLNEFKETFSLQSQSQGNKSAALYQYMRDP